MNFQPVTILPSGWRSERFCEAGHAAHPAARGKVSLGSSTEYGSIVRPAQCCACRTIWASRLKPCTWPDRTSDALQAITEAEALVESICGRHISGKLDRLRGVFLTAMGADETQIEASFFKAIRIAKEQKSISLATRAEATYAEYRRQKASGLGGRGFRLPLC